MKDARVIANYVGRYESPFLRRDSPEPDGERPEAEWSFEPTPRADVEALTIRLGIASGESHSGNRRT